MPELASTSRRSRAKRLSADRHTGQAKSAGLLGFSAVTALLAVALAASGAPSPLYVEYAKRWHMTEFDVSIVYAAYAGGVIITLLLFGGLSDQLGRRKVLLVSSGLLALSMVCFVAAQDLPLLVSARALQGLATGFLTGAAAPALTELHPRRDPTSSGMVNAASTSGGIAIGALVSGACAEWLPWPLRLPYLILIVVIACLAAVIAVGVPETVHHDSANTVRLVRVQRLAVPAACRGQFVVAGACVVAAWSVAGLYLALGGTLVQDLLHLHNHLVAGLVILLVQGVGGATQIVLRRLDDRAAARIGLIFLLVGVLVVAWALRETNASAFVAGDLVTGVGFGLTFMSGTRRVSRAAPPHRRGEVMAAYFFVAYLAISLPVLLVARVAHHLGLTTTYEVFAAAVSAMCIAALFAAEVIDRRG